MQIRTNKGRAESASVLVIVLCIGMLLGIGATSYMIMVSTQHKLSNQSLAWNTALTLAEAGIEDGLAQINVTFGTNFHSSANTNWGYASGVYGPRSQTLSNGSYSVIVVAGTPSPTIISTGYASAPYTLKPVKRVVKVTTTNTPPWVLAMAVQRNIDTKGNNITFDSYNSTDPSHSTNGLYDAATRMAGGDICSVGGLVNIQNANIYGKLKTGPGGSYAIGANGSVGDLNWNTPGQIQPGWYQNDFNMLFRDVDPPFTSGLPVLPVNLGTNTYILASGDYYVNSDFVLNNNETLAIQGNVRLYVTGSMTMKSANGSFINIYPGASLKLYVGTASGPPASTQLTMVNNSGTASTFHYFGLPSNTTMSWSGNAIYIGTVYAPEVNFTASGGGSTALDWQGSCIVSNATLNGHFSFHYDEDLKRNKEGTGFSVTSWTEL